MNGGHLKSTVLHALMVAHDRAPAFRPDLHTVRRALQARRRHARHPADLDRRKFCRQSSHDGSKPAGPPAKARGAGTSRIADLPNYRFARVDRARFRTRQMPVTLFGFLGLTSWVAVRSLRKITPVLWERSGFIPAPKEQPPRKLSVSVRREVESDESFVIE